MEEPIVLRMSARTWSGIDASADNAAATARANGDEHTEHTARAVREAGWDQVPWVDGQWPPMDQVISIQLTRVQWRFAAEQARRSLLLSEMLHDEQSAQLARDALAVIEPAL